MLKNPNLVVISVVVPLDNVSFIVSFTSLDIQCLSAERFDVEGIWLSHEVSWNELPEFIDLLVGLTANDSGSVVLTSLRHLNCLIRLGTEDTVLVSSDTLKVEFLVGTIVPLIDDQMVEFVLTLRNVQDHLA